MTLDDQAFDNEMASSFLRALRENSDLEGNRNSVEGRSYNTGKFFGVVTAGTTGNLYIENPSNSGAVIFPKAKFTSGGQILYNKIDGVTIDSAGTTEDANNRLIADGATQANIESDVSYSGGNVWTKQVAGGQENVFPGTGDPSASDIVLDEGDNILYKFENASGTDIRVTISVSFVEVDRGDVSELSN